MNNLSWFLYFSDLVSKIYWVSLISTLLFFCIWFILPPKGKEPFGSSHPHPFMGFEYAKIPLVVAVISSFMWFILPSKDTIYLIAGSEASEAVVSTPEARAILNDVQEVIRSQLDNLKVAKTPTN